ncbi:MAG: S-layer homology domain-containing protein, partial [Clostridia bacterium]|nr:S-layer homology domain-containing protein [Clostridia bacterium]
MKNRILSLLLAVVLVCSLALTAFAASSEATDAANTLHNLGLFNGTGTNADGTPIYDLDRVPSRFEAVTMLVRLLGKEAEAKAGTWDTPFTDVVDWAKPYVGYAYANGLTAGTSATTFGGSAIVTASQYLTFVLRSLGYESGKDFQWDKAWEFSDKIGMTDGRYNADTKTFLHGDVAIISNNALYMNVANSDKTLLDSFNARGFGMLEQNEKTMTAGGKSVVVKIDGKLYDNAPLTLWAYEFNGEISEYMNASCILFLKVLTKDYTLQKSQSATIEEAINYDMSQTARVGYSQWNASPKPGVTQAWATYHYDGNKF